MLVKILPFLFLAGCAAGLADGKPPTFTEAEMHKARCTAKGEVVIALTEGETEQELRLQNLIRLDDDCKAVFGSAPVKITVGK